MQRPTYGHNSPPLHHPVPQHVSTVPQLRSPPPPPGSQPQSNNYGNPYQQQGAQQAGQPGMGGVGAGAANMFGQYGNFMNDPAAQVAAHFSQSAMKQGQDFLEQNACITQPSEQRRTMQVNRYVNVSALKHYFNVTNAYVLSKLFLVLFPWRHKPWSRKQTSSHHPSSNPSNPNQPPQQSMGTWYLPPRDDINSPDMYIPVMSLVTYILLSTLLAGLRGQFQPELLGSKAATALVVVTLEILGLKLGTYLLSISNESQLLDLVAYSGYKFVGVITTVAIAEIFNKGKGTGGWVGWGVFVYTFLANSLFLMRSLKYVLLPENGGDMVGGPGGRSGGGVGVVMTDSRAKRNQRTQFLFFYSYVVQFVLMWILSRA